jgi:hypothetical protein
VYRVCKPELEHSLLPLSQLNELQSKASQLKLVLQSLVCVARSLVLL